MFNVCVDALIREWLWRTIDKEATHGRFAGASREIVAFFVDNRLVRSRDLVWLQGTLNILVTLFEIISLRTNPDKTKVMCASLGIFIYPTQKRCTRRNSTDQSIPPQSIIGWIATSVA
jgi:hypothetical protein